MLSTLSATESSFLMVALLQAVASLVWGACAVVVADARRAAMHWSIWAALSSLTWFVLAMRLDSPPVLAVACGVVGALALRRGVRAFVGLAFALGPPAALLAAVFAADWLAEGPGSRHWQAAVNFGVLASIYAGIAMDLRRHARDDLGWRWPVALGLPPLLGAAAFGTRAARALLDPASVVAEMATHSALNVGSAFGYLVLVLLLHATLLALVAGRLVTSLRRLSRHDGLTGLLNRRAIGEALDAQRQRSLRSGEPFALMMLDLDHFKSLNDRHGHAVGDQALKQVAALLRGSLREVDRLGRYGGEEFLILLPGLTLAEALAVARRLCADLAARRLHTGSATITVSASVGVAAWRGGPCDVEQVLAQADAALFQAKLAGRNRAASAGASAGEGDNADP